MDWKQVAIDYFSFTRRDRIGIITILVLILGIFLLPGIISPSGSKQVSSDTSWMASLRELEQKDTDNHMRVNNFSDENSFNYQYDRTERHNSPQPGAQLFYFDPNNLSTEGWKKLGLRPKTINTIKNFLSKGGQFRSPEDLRRIYGLFPDEFERIAPYINIAPNGKANSIGEFERYPSGNKPPPGAMAHRYAVIDINLADTTAFISLPGIGSRLAGRIVNFRERLGGFYSVAQVGETYGLADSTFQKIKQYLKLENALVRKININTATVDELKAHPYIRWGLANPIDAYRKEHGLFSSLAEIKRVMAVTNEVYEKIAPYLTIQ